MPKGFFNFYNPALKKAILKGQYPTKEITLEIEDGVKGVHLPETNTINFNFSGKEGFEKLEQFRRVFRIFCEGMKPNIGFFSVEIESPPIDYLAVIGEGIKKDLEQKFKPKTKDV